MRTLFFMMLASDAFVFSASAAEPTGADQTVWKLEEDYRRYVQAGDVVVVHYAAEEPVVAPRL